MKHATHVFDLLQNLGFEYNKDGGSHWFRMPETRILMAGYAEHQRKFHVQWAHALPAAATHDVLPLPVNPVVPIQAMFTLWAKCAHLVREAGVPTALTAATASLYTRCYFYTGQDHQQMPYTFGEIAQIIDLDLPAATMRTVVTHGVPLDTIQQIAAGTHDTHAGLLLDIYPDRRGARHTQMTVPAGYAW